jgi:hypothetical protein
MALLNEFGMNYSTLLDQKVSGIIHVFIASCVPILFEVVERTCFLVGGFNHLGKI